MVKELMDALIKLLWSLTEIFVSLFLRPIWKFVAHFVTGQCELERIVFNNMLSNYEKNLKIEYSLKTSKMVNFDQLTQTLNYPLTDDVDKAVEIVVSVKQLNKTSKRVDEFKMRFAERLAQILGYESLKRQVEIERTDFYNSENPAHEKRLLQLWSLLMPVTALTSRISNQWPQIGFQGDDPATDFRGMGLLGLNQLIYFSTTFNRESCGLMHKSNHPTKGYPYAIVGISMTSLVRDLLRGNYLKRQFSMQRAGSPSMLDLHRLYCRIFLAFDNFWYDSNPASIMDYVPLRTKFYAHLIVQTNCDEDVFDLKTSSVEPEL